MKNRENNREGRGKDRYRYITTGKRERKLKGKGKEESKAKVSRWDEERRGEEEEKMYGTSTLAIFIFTSYRLRKKQEIRPDIRYPAPPDIRYPAKSVSGASLHLSQEPTSIKNVSDPQTLARRRPPPLRPPRSQKISGK